MTSAKLKRSATGIGKSRACYETVADIEIIENPSDVDWGTMYDLIQRSYAYMDGVIDPPSSLHRMSVDDFERKAKDETLVIATSACKLVGCMFCRKEADWIYVGKVAVAPHRQGEGIGAALFDRAFDLAKREGAKGLELETRVELFRNHKTFERLGFVKVGEDAHAGYDRPTSIRMRAEV